MNEELSKVYKNIIYFSILDDEEKDIYKGIIYPSIFFNNGKLCPYYNGLKDFKKIIELNFTF